MSLSADPPACTVPAAGGSSTHKLVNAGAEKLIFKIKSSNNNEYRIAPIFGFVEPSGSTTVVVTRNAGASQEDMITVSYASAPANAKVAHVAFSYLEPTGILTIPVWSHPEPYRKMVHQNYRFNDRYEKVLTLSVGPFTMTAEVDPRGGSLFIDYRNDETMHLGSSRYLIQIQVGVVGHRPKSLQYYSCHSEPHKGIMVPYDDRNEKITIHHEIVITEMKMY